MSARARVTLAMASIVSACDTTPPVEARDVVTLVMVEEDDWTGDEKQALRNAAEAWNLEFGTHVELHRDGEKDVQRVRILFDETACINDSNERTLAHSTWYPPQTAVCPDTANDKALLFETLRHELGHILGIPAHSKDTFAVMTGRATERVHWFRDDDRRLFFAANPGWGRIETGCEIAPRIAQGQPTLADPSEAPIHLVWSETDGIHFAPLDSATGKIGEEIGWITTTSVASPLEAYSTPEGFLVAWLEENRIHLSPIGLPSGEPGEPLTAELPLVAGSFYRLSAVRVAPYDWLAITIEESPTDPDPQLHLFQIDEASGAIIRSATIDGLRGKLVEHEDQLYLLTGQIFFDESEYGISIHRLVENGETIDLRDSLELARVTVGLDTTLLPQPILAAQSSRMGVLVLIEDSIRSIQLARVSTDGPLAVEDSITLEASSFIDPVILEVDDFVFIAGAMYNAEHYDREGYVIQLRAETLDVARGWRRVSSPDTMPFSRPHLAVDGNHLVTVWGEATDDVRSRCLEFY